MTDSVTAEPCKHLVSVFRTGGWGEPEPFSVLKKGDIFRDVINGGVPFIDTNVVVDNILFSEVSAWKSATDAAMRGPDGVNPNVWFVSAEPYAYVVNQDHIERFLKELTDLSSRYGLVIHGSVSPNVENSQEAAEISWNQEKKSYVKEGL